MTSPAEALTEYERSRGVRFTDRARRILVERLAAEVSAGDDAAAALADLIGPSEWAYTDSRPYPAWHCGFCKSVASDSETWACAYCGRQYCDDCRNKNGRDMFCPGCHADANADWHFSDVLSALRQMEEEPDGP